MTPVKSRISVEVKKEPENQVGILESFEDTDWINPRGQQRSGSRRKATHNPAIFNEARSHGGNSGTNVQHRSKSGLPGRYEPFCWEGVATMTTSSQIIFILSGVLYALLRYEPSHDVPHIKDNVEVKGICSSYPVKTEAGTVRQPFSVESAVNSVAGEKIDALDGKEIMLFSDKKLDAGTEYDFIVKLLRSRQRLNPGQQVRDDIYANLLEVRNSGNQRLSLHSMIEKNRYRVNSFIEENLGKDSGAFVESITTGETANISEEPKDAFSITGLTHILSISGSHFGIFSVLLFGVFRFFINAMPYRVLQRITVFLTPSQIAAVFCLPFMLAYLGLSGASIPAVRSFIMISIVLLGLLIGRKGFWLNSLVFAAFVIVVWDPESLFSPSLKLCGGHPVVSATGRSHPPICFRLAHG